MTTVCPSSDGYFQQDNTLCHKAQIISNWFLEHDNEFAEVRRPPQSPDLNPTEHLWDVVEREIGIMDLQLTYLQQLRDAIMSRWSRISEECFQHLVDRCHKELRQLLLCGWVSGMKQYSNNIYYHMAAYRKNHQLSVASGSTTTRSSYFRLSPFSSCYLTVPPSGPTTMQE